MNSRAASSVELAGDEARFQIAHRRHGTGPEHLPDDRGIGQDRLRLRRKRVEAGGQQGLDRLRNGQLSAVAQEQPVAPGDEQVAVAEQSDELLHEQRVAAGAIEHRLAQLG